MHRRHFILGTVLSGAAAPPFPAASADPRNVANGSVIPDEGYCDQPYIVITKDGKWLCVLTTGRGVEGEPGQHIVATISGDQGRTWSPLIDIEPANGPEASWVMPLLVPSGRVYVFYTYNKDNLRVLPNCNHEKMSHRVDTMGVYAFKYSDDNGRTWSRQRFEIPMRQMRIDRENNNRGAIMYFWGVGKPIVAGKSAVFGFAKVGKWGFPGGMVESQGCFLRSDNILTERDPRKLRWVLLPDGDEGLSAPKGPVSDEANLVSLSDGSLYATYRTIDGYNCHAYSRDGGHTWTPPAYATYTPGGRRIKHNRAANFVRKFSNGKFLLWFHNHGGEQFHASPRRINHYLGRNPSWICGGVEKNGLLHWSEPEIVLYNDDPAVGSSYPDFIEDGGRFYISETQKTVARIHEIDRTLLEGAWNQFENKTVAQRGLLLDLNHAPAQFDMPRLGGSFSLDFWIRLRELTERQVILDTRGPNKKGMALLMTERASIQLVLNDGTREWNWESDYGTHPGTLRVNAWQHVAVIVDGGPGIVSFVVDGVFNDGGALRDYGWGRLPKGLGDCSGGAARLAPAIFGQLARLRVYGRYLRTSEAVGNWRAGM